MLAHPANYGLANALCGGLSIDAIDAVNCNMPSAAINGFGTNFIFLDSRDPTAMVHAWMANTAQQLVSPARISQITALKGSNRVVMANVPVGQYGQVNGRTNLSLGNWTTNVNNINTTSPTQTVYVPASGSQVVLPAEIPLLLDLAVARRHFFSFTGCVFDRQPKPPVPAISPAFRSPSAASARSFPSRCTSR